ncbi:MAG: biotin/lipoyl-containing protein [Pseudomonadales bacterium]
MDLRKIKKLIELVEESGITELEVRDGEEVIRIARQITAAGFVPVPQPAAVAGISAAPGHSIESPMAGTFYAAAEPGSEPFLRLGAQVEVGDIVCIIESMKMMNEITATASGICTAVEATNGEAVNSGQVLFRLE